MKVIVVVEKTDSQGSERWRVFNPYSKKWKNFQALIFDNPKFEAIEIEVEQ